MTSQQLINAGYVKDPRGFNPAAQQERASDTGDYYSRPAQAPQAQARQENIPGNRPSNVPPEEYRAAGYTPVPGDTGRSSQASDGSWWEPPEGRRQANAADVNAVDVSETRPSRDLSRQELESESEEQRQNRLRFEGREAGFELEDLLRGQAGEIVAEGGRALTREQKAIGLQEQELRRQAARALASSLSSGAPIGGGAAAAQGRQTALDVGAEVGGVRAAGERRKAEIAAGTERERRLALERAGAAKLERIISEREAGGAQATNQKEISEIESQIQGIIQSNTGNFGLNEEAAASDIRNLRSQYSSQSARAYITKRANEVAARSLF